MSFAPDRAEPQGPHRFRAVRRHGIFLTVFGLALYGLYSCVVELNNSAFRWMREMSPDKKWEAIAETRITDSIPTGSESTEIYLARPDEPESRWRWVFAYDHGARDPAPILLHWLSPNSLEVEDWSYLHRSPASKEVDGVTVHFRHLEREP